MKYKVKITRCRWLHKPQQIALLPLVFCNRVGPTWIVSLGWLWFLYDIQISNKNLLKQMCNTEEQKGSVKNGH